MTSEIPFLLPFVPLGSRVLVEPDPPPERVGSIYVPSGDRPEISGRILAVGSAAQCLACHETRPWPEELAVGAHVMFSPRAGQEVTLGSTRYLLLQVKEILAVMEDDDG